MEIKTVSKEQLEDLRRGKGGYIGQYAGKKILNEIQIDIINTLSKNKELSRKQMKLLGINSNRKDLRYLERQEIITKRENYIDGTRYYVYKLV